MIVKDLLFWEMIVKSFLVFDMKKINIQIIKNIKILTIMIKKINIKNRKMIMKKHAIPEDMKKEMVKIWIDVPRERIFQSTSLS